MPYLFQYLVVATSLRCHKGKRGGSAEDFPENLVFLLISCHFSPHHLPQVFVRPWGICESSELVISLLLLEVGAVIFCQDHKLPNKLTEVLTPAQASFHLRDTYKFPKLQKVQSTWGRGPLTYQDLKSCGVSPASFLPQGPRAQIPLHPNVRLCTLNPVLPRFLKSQIAGG